MPKMIVSIDEVVVKEAQLTKDKTTLGRRPYNDIVIDNMAVSGEHARLLMADGEVTIEDLNSTNGTYVNGKSIKKQTLHNGDTIDVGRYKIKFVLDSASDNVDAPVAPMQNAAIKVLSGAAAGREVLLTKAVTTVGKPGVLVAAITKRQHGYVVHHVEGGGNPTLNGSPISAEPLSLKNGDVIELAGTQMRFVQV